jgi:predicted DNA-binding transcriptional regulator YafY
MDKTFARYLALLETIPRSGKRSTTEIAERLAAKGFKTYPRMVQRDLQLLSSEFQIECDDRSKPFGWRWRQDARALSLPGMTTSQALSFHLVEAYLRNLFPAQVLDELRPYFAESKRLLDDVSRRTPLGRWPARVRVQTPEMPLRPAEIKPAVHAAVTDALLLGRQLEIHYVKKAGTGEAKHRIHPLGLIQHGRVLYLSARYYEFETARLVAVHRISRATVLEAAVDPPKDYSLDGWIASGVLGFGGSGKPMRVKLEFSEGAGNHLLESPLAEDQVPEIADDERLTLSATVRDTERLRWWLMGFGPRVKVLAPKALRDDVAARLQAASRQYAARAEAAVP